MNDALASAAANWHTVRMRTDLSFFASNVSLAAWLYQPETPGPHPLIVLSHGFSAIMEMGLAHSAEAFTAAGFACLVYNHRNFAGSGGEPRFEIDPWQQVADMRDALSFARTLPNIAPDRIGLWGTSYSGGHALVVAALDRRVRCVVSQVPLVAGYATLRSWVPEAAWPKLEARFIADRDARYRGEPPRTTQPAHPGSTTWAWVEATRTESVYPNEITQRSLELLGSYEPGQFVARIAPTPLLMILATRDEQTPFATQRVIYDQAGEPKRLVLLDCEHYAPYTSHFAPACAAACEWFKTHL